MPSWPSASLTTSKSPWLTPPLVTTRSARTSWSAERVGEGARVVGDDPDAVGDGAGRAGGGGQQVGVAVVDRVVAQRRPGLAQLGAGRDDHDPRAGTAPDGGPADGGEQPEVARAQDGAVLDEEVALLDVVAAGADVLPGGGHLGDPHLGDAAVGPLVGDDGVAAARHGAPVMILTAVPGERAIRSARPAPISPDHRQVHRLRRATR